MNEMEQMVKDCQGAIKTLAIGGLEAIKLAGESDGKLAKEINTVKGMLIGMGLAIAGGVTYLIIKQHSQNKRIAKLEKTSEYTEVKVTQQTT